jgi:glycosyltransferase involved in cell wall biosynthesis
MPVYNGERYLAEAVKSILDQTEGDLELVIIDDGSADGSAKIVKSFSDPRVRLICTPHEGLVAALNRGITTARGKYIARMDADDISFPERFKVQSELLETNPDIGICGSWAEIIDKNDKKLGEATYPPINDVEIRRYGKFHNPFIHSSVMIRADFIKQTGGYRAFFRHVEDYELWTRILKRSRGANIPKMLIRYRRHSAQITERNNPEMKIRGLVARILAWIRL